MKLNSDTDCMKLVDSLKVKETIAKTSRGLRIKRTVIPYHPCTINSGKKVMSLAARRNTFQIIGIVKSSNIFIISVT